MDSKELHDMHNRRRRQRLADLDREESDMDEALELGFLMLSDDDVNDDDDSQREI